MRSCVAVPIKTINTRLPNKTFREIDGQPLYSYLFSTLSDLKTTADIGEAFIYSSDKKVLDIAERWDFKPVEQPAEYDTNPKVTGDFLIQQMMPNFVDYDTISWLHITSPFLSKETVKTALKFLKDNKEVDSVLTVVPRQNRFWYQGNPVNHDPLNLIRTQDLTPMHEEADSYFFRKKSFEKYGKRVCGKIHNLEVSRKEAVDIDYLEDLLYAESLVKNGLVRI